MSERTAGAALTVFRWLPIDGLVRLVAAYDDLWIPPRLLPVADWFRKLADGSDRSVVLFLRTYQVRGLEVVPADIEAVDDVCFTVVSRSNGRRFRLDVVEFELVAGEPRWPPVMLFLNQPQLSFLDDPFPYAFFRVDVRTQAVLPAYR